MAHTLDVQISQLQKDTAASVRGLIQCATDYLSRKSGIGPSCQSISYLKWGNMNPVYKLVFSDDTQLAASVSQDIKDFGSKAKQAEIDTMRFVRQSGLYPDIPVQNVHAWDSTFDNPVGAPYVLMDVLPGEILEVNEDGNEMSGLDALTQTQQLSVVKELAKLKASLSKPVPFSKLGTIVVDGAGEGQAVGPFITLGGPFESLQELWSSVLQTEMLRAVRDWCENETDEISTSPSDPKCTPQTYSELYRLLASLILYFKLPKQYTPLVLHLPNISLQNILFDKESLSTDQPKIRGVLSWRGAQILPLMLSARYPDDLVSTGDEPFEHPAYNLEENWSTVPFDWTSIGDNKQWLKLAGDERAQTDFTPQLSALVRKFYLRAYFSASYAEQIRLMHGDTDLAHARLFADAPYYLKLHEVVCGGWQSWVRHASWIRETYRRLRSVAAAGGEVLIIGPNIFRGSVNCVGFDLGLEEESTSAV